LVNYFVRRFKKHQGCAFVFASNQSTVIVKRLLGFWQVTESLALDDDHAKQLGGRNHAMVLCGKMRRAIKVIEQTEHSTNVVTAPRDLPPNKKDRFVLVMVSPHAAEISLMIRID